MTIFGTSAKYIDAVQEDRLAAARHHDLAGVRTMLSTGSPLAPESFDFVYDAIKPDLHLASISGGTDIVACFVPAIRSSRSGAARSRGPALGMAVDVFDDDGKPLAARQGRTRLHAAFPVDAGRLLERSRRGEIPRRLFRALPQYLVPWRFRRMDRAWRHDHPRPLRRHAQSRRRAHRHGGNLRPGRADAGGARGAGHRPGLGQ